MTHAEELQQMYNRIADIGYIENSKRTDRIDVFFGAVLLALNDLILDLNGEYKEDE